MKYLKNIFLLVACAISLSSYATTYKEKSVGYMRSPDDRPCLLFQLNGVSDVDGSGNAWFALPTGNNYKDILSMLLAAKMSDRKVDVSTTGAVAEGCGHTEVVVIGIP
ncbi:MAG: hypothetical protein COB58_10635 [Thalassobium sp.]|nr:MAG: hypothetical protein COB58_14560 [Thalassobium sp.]PHQ84523.1 MAG: hypothetical protein COB58_10635 [Thalassobium sp.]